MRAVSRAWLLRTLAAFSSIRGPPPLPASASFLGRRRQPDEVVLPLLQCGSAFCTEYRIDGQRFRAVVDTGSPFLLALSELDCVGGPERWGCYSDERSIGGGLLDDESEEGFGGQDVGVEWRRGALRLSSVSKNDPSALADRRRGARSGAWTLPNDATDLLVEPINFGVVKSFVGKGGSGAIYLGLAKDRSARVRPTLLEQTAVQSYRFDFDARILTLSSRALITGDAIPLLDLRTVGAPIAPPACLVHRLYVNGRRVPLERPCIAVVDTGTTGLVVSDSLYDSDELPMPGAAVRNVTVEVLTENGRVCTLQASRRRAQKAPAGREGELQASVVAALEGGRRADEPPFPLIVTPVHLPWFDGKRRQRAKAAAREAAGEAAGEPSLAPHVLFLGLAFLCDTLLTVDCDADRMTVVPGAAMYVDDRPA
jgi:hypothetical protein